ncbi:cyanophycinase [Alkalimonas amylolytica]|uniref:Cyanophycinase n=1 Tax=Alkalimonas amylolytica TaxID=152573 RepID=A0A1H4EH96_ALKAM|nr:cyanophycinase [Alkalimonas amylolytica]SEA84209.1 cyanophycinase [Alkalimonas amylolytica]
MFIQKNLVSALTLGVMVLLIVSCSSKDRQTELLQMMEDLANAKACGYGPRPELPANLTRYAVGYTGDVCVPLDAEQAGVILMGGSTDVDSIFAQKVRPYIQGGNVLVLRTRGGAGYNQYLQQLTEAASVETLLVDSRDKANSDYVAWAVQSAEFIWFAGGDQSEYIRYWQDTRLQQKLHYAYHKGAIIGGTSAGNAILGEVVYNPDGVGSAVSNEVAKDFCDGNIRFSGDFLQAPMLAGSLTDTHFKQRDRMGRLMVFLAHHPGKALTGIAVSEQTALWVARDGQTEVFGAHEVYILRADEQSRFRQTECGKPVIIDDLLRYRLTPGDHYQLGTHQSSVAPLRISLDGRQNPIYQPSNPY